MTYRRLLALLLATLAAVAFVAVMIGVARRETVTAADQDDSARDDLCRRALSWTLDTPELRMQDWANEALENGWGDLEAAIGDLRAGAIMDDFAMMNDADTVLARACA